jgi:Domain of unknown function (DUF397)
MDSEQHVAWRRARKCDTGACVEWARVGKTFMLRDSKNSDGPTLTFTSDAWTTFVQGVRDGDFD